MLWVLLGVYAKQNYGLLENEYGLISATNALMVVLFQVGVTRITMRYPALPLLALGALVYALGVGSIVLGDSFWDFWLSYVVVTIGELIILPTASSQHLASASHRMDCAFAAFAASGQRIVSIIVALVNDLAPGKREEHGNARP